jgi:hypothetical protein
MNFRATASAAHPKDSSIPVLAASGTEGGNGGEANEGPVAMTMAKTSRPRDHFDFCIFSFYDLVTTALIETFGAAPI